MKTRLLNPICAALLVAGLVACGGSDDAPTPAPLVTVDPVGATTVNVSTLENTVATYPVAALSAAEAASLAFMREEEQLAHDVYAVSASLWSSVPIFANITSSEATHSAAIKVLLDRYQQPDPLAGLPNGTFKSPAFQTLYNKLVAASRVSLIDALKVGVEIEELDIRDINAQKAVVDNADILMVYNNLLDASASHLRAFMAVLTQHGGTYVPKYLTQAEFDAIIKAPTPGLLVTVDPVGATSVNVSTLENTVATYPVAALSSAEAASLAFMREEEQLAHDVYAVSASLWPQPVFDNITKSEATHSAAIKVLLDRYQQPDPLAGLPNGTFKTPAFQTLYNNLVATSRLSLINALKVGVEIEELDIRDINAQKALVDNADILMVYTNLVDASASHLRAFMKVLTLNGGTYVPKYLTQAEFDAILNAK